VIEYVVIFQTSLAGGVRTGSLLYDVSLSFKDVVENNSVFTPFSIVSNPDFDKIRNSGSIEYYYEAFPIRQLLK